MALPLGRMILPLAVGDGFGLRKLLTKGSDQLSQGLNLGRMAGRLNGRLNSRLSGSLSDVLASRLAIRSFRCSSAWSNTRPNSHVIGNQHQGTAVIARLNAPP
jgi:hypothetical protein